MKTKKAKKKTTQVSRLKSQIAALQTDIAALRDLLQWRHEQLQIVDAAIFKAKHLPMRGSGR